MSLLDEYTVDENNAWGKLEAAHLLRRAGFGGTPEEIEAAEGDGSQQALLDAVDQLVNYSAADPNLDASSALGPWGGPIAGLPDDPDDEDSSNDTNE